jgi:hypothetical protein
MGRINNGVIGVPDVFSTCKGNVRPILAGLMVQALAGLTLLSCQVFSWIASRVN